MENLFDPIIGGVQHYTYHREPTEAEIKFGYGATHYRDFHPSQCVKKSDGLLKKWLLADDGLRYYR